MSTEDRHRRRHHRRVPQLSREDIADVAMWIADHKGLDAVSIRGIAREIGSGAMSLYHYFDSRDELIDALADRIAGEMVVAGELPEDWREALTAIAQHTRATMKKHPWMHLALQSRPRVTPNLLRHIEQSAQAVAGLADRVKDPTALPTIVSAVDDYTIGYTLRELVAVSPDERGQGIADVFERDLTLRDLIGSGEFPLLQRFVESGMTMPEQRFEDGLTWLLDGFAAAHGL